MFLRQSGSSGAVRHVNRAGLAQVQMKSRCAWAFIPGRCTGCVTLSVNVAGGGINDAQRVMDCGDAGHILASGAIAEVLKQHSSWSPCLHEIGLAEVKHGMQVRIFNLHTEQVGNAAVPAKLSKAAAANIPIAEKGGNGFATPITLELLEKTTKKLAGYIGPIASIVVKRTARKCSSAQELFLSVAEEIKSSEERDRFLSSLRER